MFGIGISEIVLITIVAIIVVGPKNLPVALRSIGRAIAEFRRSMAELRKDVALDEVVDEVTRPLREGMAGVQRDLMNAGDEALDGFNTEYPEEGPDTYDALAETAGVYPDVRRDYGAEKAALLAGGGVVAAAKTGEPGPDVAVAPEVAGDNPSGAGPAPGSHEAIVAQKQAFAAKEEAIRVEKERYAEKQRQWAAEKEAYLRSQAQRESSANAAVEPGAGVPAGKSSEAVVAPKDRTGAAAAAAIVVKPVEGTIARSTTDTDD